MEVRPYFDLMLLDDEIWGLVFSVNSKIKVLIKIMRAPCQN